MLTQSLYTIFDLQSDEQIVAFYMGIFSKEGTENLLTNVRNIIESQRDAIKVKTKVFKIAIELIHNIVKHCSNKGDEAMTKNYFLIVRSASAYKIKTGNCIYLSEQESVTHRINTINAKDKHQLKQDYLEILGQIDSKMINAGGGIGLIETALCSQNPIEFNFTPIDEVTAFFVVNVTYTIS